jgi:hypothetical protein
MRWKNEKADSDEKKHFGLTMYLPTLGRFNSLKNQKESIICRGIVNYISELLHLCTANLTSNFPFSTEMTTRFVSGLLN